MAKQETGTKEKRAGRPRRERIEVWATGEEKAAITESAEAVGMTASAYLRALALNTPIRSKADYQAIADLVKVTGDLGRVAGLLRLWLAEKRGQGAHPSDVEAMMLGFRKLQREVRQATALVMK
ncbi:plasmid mobilization protein [Castellaniella sp.]|uniref:plasmid mobilization protein n=1 Tax=Castellaniella sp. TaxID=1955812 RepID=UPI002AFF4919|nr:conjugal transfer protein TraJ [Castellaniella sp.]